MIFFTLALLFSGNTHNFSMHLVKKISMHQRPYQAAFSCDGRYLAVAGEYGTILYSTSDWSRRRTIHQSGNCLSPIAESSKFAIDSGNKVYVIGPDSKTEGLELPSLNKTTSNLTVTGNGKTLGIFGNRVMRLYDVATHKLILKREVDDGYTGQLIGTDSSVALSIWGYSTHNGGAVILYPSDTSQPPVIKTFPISGPYALAYSPATRRLYIGCIDGRLYTMNIAGNNLRFLCRPRHQNMECLSVSPDGSLVAIGYRRDSKHCRGRDMMLLVDGRSGHTLTKKTRTYGVQGLRFAPDGKTLAQTDRGGNLRIFRCRP